MTIINLTPHSINFVNEDGTPVLAVAPSGQLARVSARTVKTGRHFAVYAPEEETGFKLIPETVTEYGEVEGLPAPADDTIYVVSSLVASRCMDRPDVFIPNESVRDAQGRIIGCKSLGRV